MLQRPIRRRAFALAAALSAFLAACGGVSDGGGNASRRDGDGPYGGSAVVGTEALSLSFCLPEAQLSFAGMQVARAAYDTLTKYDENRVRRPYLAKTFEPNEDFTNWTIELRPGITFHDGSPLTAEVVKNNLDAYRNKYLDASGKQVRQALLTQFVFEAIEEVVVHDDLRLEVKMNQPWADFGVTAATPSLAIIGQAQLDDPSGCGSKLVGTGPFRLPGGGAIADFNEIRLERNPDYWLEDGDGNQLPYLDQITFRVVAEPTQRVNSLETGNVHMTYVADSASVAQVRSLEQQGKVTSFASHQYPDAVYWLLNSSAPPFDSKVAREAVAMGFDRAKLTEMVFGEDAQPANGPFSPGSFGSLEDSGYPDFDPDAARAKVAQYKAETGQDLSFTLSTVADSVNTPAAQIFQQMMREVGIEVQISSTNQVSLITDAVGGRIQASIWRNHGSNTAQGQILWWHSGYLTNFGKIADPQLDALLREGRATNDEDELQRIYAEVTRLFGREVYNAWIAWPNGTVGASSTIEGFAGPPLPDADGAREALSVVGPVSGLRMAG